MPWTYVISDLDGEKFVGTFYEKELKKLNQEQFRIQKLANYMSNIKVSIIHLIVGLKIYVLLKI